MQFRKSSISTNTKNVVQSAELVEICSIPGVTPVGIFMFKVNNRNTRNTGVFIVNFEHILHLVLVFLLLTLNL